jgi:hypothetical protein
MGERRGSIENLDGQVGEVWPIERLSVIRGIRVNGCLKVGRRGRELREDQDWYKLTALRKTVTNIQVP